MQNRITFTLIFLSLFAVSLYGQHSFTITGGVSNSMAPIYTLKNNTSVLSSQSVNKLTLAAGYNHAFNKNFVLKSRIAFKNIGVNTLNKQADQEDLFINNASLAYASFSVIPFGELRFRQLTFAAGVGPTVSLLVKGRIENYIITNTGLEFFDKENLEFSKWDSGITAVFEVNRIIANGLKLILSVERYQGLKDVSRFNNNVNQLYLSNSSISLGLEFPLKNKKA